LGLLNLTPTTLLANAIALLIGMTLHEFAHAWVATRMGDPTPRQQGRLTLNPFVHINWIGFLMFAVIGFGMLGSTPISPRRMRNPRWGAVAALAAGPLANLLIALIFALVFRVVEPMFYAGSVPGMVMTILQTIVFINVLLFLFNLIPLFPLDGWRIVEALLPVKAANWWADNRQNSFYLVILLIVLSLVPPGYGVPDILGTLIGRPTAQISFSLLGYI